jgi:hypothetical protein
MADATKGQEDPAKLVERDYESYKLLLGLWQADSASAVYRRSGKGRLRADEPRVVGAYHLYYLHNA